MARLAGAWIVGAMACACAAAAQACNPDAPPLAAGIPSRPVDHALRILEDQTELQWVSEARFSRWPRSRSVPAGITPEQALRTMLQGTGLQYRCVTRRLAEISVLPRPPVVADVPVEEPDEHLEEVVVTGRQNQPLPSDTTAYNAEWLLAAGIKDIDEIGFMTPGVEFDYLSSVGSGPYTNLAIRGVTDRHGNTAGVWLDDIPLPAAASNSFARGFPYAFDMARAEVLRGPQPVLLGANSQGGAIQFMPTQPSLTAFSARAHAEWAATQGGDSTWEAGAAVGGPLEHERLGLRLGGWYRSEGGFVDRVNPFTNDNVAFTREMVERNSSRATVRSARVALRYDPVPSVTLIPAHYYQSTDIHDSPAFMIYESALVPGDTMSDPASGRFYNGSLIRQPFVDSYHLSSLKGLVRLGRAQLQSVTGYFQRSAHMSSDDTESPNWGDFGNPRGPGYPVSHEDLIRTDVTLKQRSFTQQLQLAAPTGRELSWVAGAFYSNTRSRETDHVMAARTPANGRGRGFPLDLAVPTAIEQRQLAGFGHLTYRVARRLTLSGGLRVERQQVDAESVAPPGFEQYLSADEHRNDTVVAPQYGVLYEAGGANRRRVQDYYFAAGAGYAPGNVDPARPTCLERPAVYDTDTLWSYELGTRQGWRDGRFNLDMNLFSTRWDNGNVARRTCLFMHLPGKARSEGFSLAMRTRPGRGFEVAVAMSYVDARYIETLYNEGEITVLDVNGPREQLGELVVRSGDALGTPPQVTSPWNVTASISRRLVLGGRALNLRIDDVFRSRNARSFYTSHPGVLYPANLEASPATNLLNFRARLELGAVDLGLFVNNVLDARPVLLKRNKGNDLHTLFYATTLRPRTVGVTATWKRDTPR